MEKWKLLIVDDDSSVCEGLRLVGERCGFSVTVAFSTKTFYDAYTILHPEFITLDLNFEQGDGIELLRFLAKNNSESKIIIISGYDEKVINSALLLGRSLKLNIIAALRKPVDIGRLKALLQQPYVASLQITQGMLSDAIKHRDFLLYYQPKISIVTGKLLGVEALVRWRLKESTIISPDSFISLTEESGLIEPLSAWISHEAIQQCADFQKHGLNISMSINMSAKSLNHLALPDELYNITKQYGVNPEKICIEITESIAMKNPTLVLDILTRLRIKGFSVSIDDFGTGYSSLIELQRMPCSELKIDKSFISNLKKGTSEFIITRSIINLGHDLGLKVVAEGVETPAAFEILKELGCDTAQGYYMGHPMPIEEFFLWLKMYVDDSMMFKFPNHLK